MTGILVTFPAAVPAQSPWARFFAAHMRVAAPANSNAGRRGILFDMSACFGAMPIVCGPLALVRAQRDAIAATGDGWYADMPREVRAMLKINRAALRIVEIDAEPGEWPELDAIIADLFDRSGLPPTDAVRRMERLVACVERIRTETGPSPDGGRAS